MENFRENLYYLFGKTYVPKKLRGYKGKTLLHISDTPESFYSSLSDIIRKLNPDYIIHTGDLVDNIKLELYPIRINSYIHQVTKLINILESSTAKEIYISLGNHDSKKELENIVKRSILIEDSEIINIENIDIKVSHYPTEIVKSPAKVNLFGHDLSLSSKINEEKIFLNGISNINILSVENLKVFTLPYPLGTNCNRLGKGKMGI